MSIDSRLKQLSPTLSARERAILILKAWNEGRPEDPAWRRTMPQSQLAGFGRYIDLMNVAHRELTLVIKSLSQMTDSLALRQAWLTSLVLWEEHVDEIRRAVRVTVREPITESEYGARVEANRAEWVSVEELAGDLAVQESVWTEADYEEDEGGNLQFTDEAWDRACEEQERWLRQRVADGTLPGRGKGRHLKVQQGAFDDLVGRTTGACPDGHLSYQVLSDSQAEQAEADRRMLKRLQAVLDWKPFDAGEGEEELPAMPGKMIEALKDSTAYHLISTWLHLATVEQVLDEIAAEFEGTDPVKPATRELLEETKRRLLSHKEQLLALKLDVVLREPLPEELDEMREFVRTVSQAQ